MSEHTHICVVDGSQHDTCRCECGATRLRAYDALWILHAAAEPTDAPPSLPSEEQVQRWCEVLDGFLARVHWTDVEKQNVIQALLIALPALVSRCREAEQEVRRLVQAVEEEFRNNILFAQDIAIHKTRSERAEETAHHWRERAELAESRLAEALKAK